MTSLFQYINFIIKLQYNFAIFCENLNIICQRVSEILHLSHYLLDDPRMCISSEILNRTYIPHLVIHHGKGAPVLVVQLPLYTADDNIFGTNQIELRLFSGHVVEVKDSELRVLFSSLVY